MQKQIIKTVKDLKIWCSYLTTDEPLAFDVETTDLKWYPLKPVGFSLCDGKRACYVPWNKQYIQTLFNILIIGTDLVIMHNSSFDLSVLFKMGIDYLKIENIFDTMVGAWLLNENKSVALKDLAKRVLKVPQFKIKTYEEAIKYGEYSEPFYNYAMNDAIWTYQLYEKEKSQLTKQGLDYIFYEVEMPFQKVLAEMTINGFAVDLDKAHKMKDFVAELLIEKQIALCKSAGLKYEIQNLIDGSREVISVNFNSSPQMIDIIENKLGLEITETTDKGAKSVGKHTLQRLKNEHEFVKLLQEYKGLQKLYNSFLVPLDNFVDEDKRVRGSLNACGTITGRISMSEPNLEQLTNPLKTPLPVNFREVYIAPKGKVLIVADYSGQELRGLTEVSKDPGLIEAFEKDKDIHLAVTNRCLNLGIPDEALYKSHSDAERYKEEFRQQRDQLKNGVVFPLIYGKTAYGMSKDMNISEELAQEWIDGFLDLYPKARKAIDNCAKFLKRYYFVRNRNGRKRRLNPSLAKSYRQAFNFLIQSLAADEMKLACARCQKLKLKYPHWDYRLLLPVHDEIVMEINERYVNEAIPIIKNEMENTMEMCVPEVVEIKVVKNYGEAK